MVTREDRSADRKKVRFPPPKAWDSEGKWTQDCVMFQECSEKHSPARCEVFKKMTSQQRLKKLDERELCRLCYLHLQEGTVGPRAGCPTDVLTVARFFTIPCCTGRLLRAASWPCRGSARRRRRLICAGRT
jgi:hypothetical protein